MAEKRMPGAAMNDWNKPGRLDDFMPIYSDWRFDFLDVPEMIRAADTVLEYPMVDKDPVDRWTFGRVTLMGDAAHPMYPRGSQGAAQAIIDARTLAEIVARGTGPEEALKEYEQARLGPTARIVRANREHPPDFIIMKVEELTGDKPFDHIDAVISQEELRRMSDEYKRIAGFALK
jgi:2-polyprenyl-6-methoxyphenol hydroxylase-like FAD-dependent oxidoreductase